MRRVLADGGFATVLHHGDDTAGSVVIIHRDRDGAHRALVKVTGQIGGDLWRVAASGESVDAWVTRQRGYDPDLWIIELDTPDLARFIDETIV